MDDSFDGNIFSSFSRFIRQERPYHSTHHHPGWSCSQRVNEEFLGGAVLGGIWSCVTGMVWVRRRQFRFPGSIAAVLVATVGGGLSLGVSLGAWQRAVCSMMRIREVDDLINPVIAGGFVGAMSEVPVYVRGKVFFAMKDDGFLANLSVAHLLRRTRPLFLTKSCVGAYMGTWYYMMVRQENEEFARSQGSPQPPQTPTYGNQKGQTELDTLNSSERHEDYSDWVIVEPPSGEFLESDDLAGL